jgi:hypothetical protein
MVNRIRLKEPIDDEVFAAAQRDLPDRIAGIDGIRTFRLALCANDELLVVIVGDSAESLDRIRVEIGNDWMRDNVFRLPQARPSGCSVRWSCLTSVAEAGLARESSTAVSRVFLRKRPRARSEPAAELPIRATGARC